MKKRVAVILMALTLTVGCSIPALAKTVYYQGQAVSWDYGRKLAVYSYSTVQTGVFKHSATANTTFSGWKSLVSRHMQNSLLALTRQQRTGTADNN